MIRIFNKKLGAEILIDENIDWIQFNIRDYEEKPYVIIEMKGFNFFSHTKKCNDCNLFLNSFGKESEDWLIKYSDKVFRLDTKQVGQIGYAENTIKVTNSEYYSGTTLTLSFHELPTEKSELKILLATAVENEDYKKACVLRDLIDDKQ